MYPEPYLDAEEVKKKKKGSGERRKYTQSSHQEPVSASWALINTSEVERERERGTKRGGVK